MTFSFDYTLDPEQIPTEKLVDIAFERGGERVLYSCPASCWSSHLDAWRIAYRGGKHHAPSPTPHAHLMFERPESYGYIRYGEQHDPVKRRAAIEHSVRSMLRSWIDDASAEDRERIVSATVEARIQGVNSHAHVLALRAGETSGRTSQKRDDPALGNAVGRGRARGLGFATDSIIRVSDPSSQTHVTVSTMVRQHRQTGT